MRFCQNKLLTIHVNEVQKVSNKKEMVLKNRQIGENDLVVELGISLGSVSHLKRLFIVS